MTDHANELRRYARKIAHPAGDVPSVMLAAADEVERLQARVDAAEKSDAESIAMYRKARDERDALQAKVEAMEKQEPLWFIDERGEPKRYHKSKADYCKYGGLDLLYALPGAKGE